MMRFHVGAVLAMALVLGAGAAASAQDALVPSDPAVVGGEQDWGAASDIVHTYSAHDFNLWAGTESPSDATTFGRICSSAVECRWLASLNLPTGASLRSLELSACDGSTSGEARFALLSAPIVPGPAVLLTGYNGTGTFVAPGCTTVVNVVSGSPTVQNSTTGYLVEVRANTGTNILWTQVRVRYRLQVSPAPASATFPADVPTTHPFFRFVEAMAASGITGGCGTGTFCPDSPVTRGQLAVFLSTALGLHFPN